VWKSVNGGTTFKPVFDKERSNQLRVTIDPKERKTIWVGTARPGPQQHLSRNGVYKSTDGATIDQPRVNDSERISKILVRSGQHEHGLRLRLPESCGAMAIRRGVYSYRPMAARLDKVLKGANASTVVR